jgi:hypothetical protein
MPGDIDSVANDVARKLGVDSTSRTAVTAALAQLVATLSRARAKAVERASNDELAALLQQARAELDVADEVLLAFDRHRHRSAFRRAAVIRRRLEAIEVGLAA